MFRERNTATNTLQTLGIAVPSVTSSKLEKEKGRAKKLHAAKRLARCETTSSGDMS